MNTTNTHRTTFDKGDIVMRSEASFPNGALVVDGYDDAGRILAHPLGGGPQYLISLQGALFLRKVSKDQLDNPSWRQSRFGIEGLEEAFIGWTDGRLWNGWEKPRFQMQEANRLLQSLTDRPYRYDPARDAFISTGGSDEEESWVAEVITLPGGETIKVYPIGTGAWCWQEEAR